MALIVDQQADFKHFCKICKKGFGCGRALGGHMRAHVIGDESGHLDDEDPANDWEDKPGGGGGADVVPPNNNKRMYALRTNPNRFKSCRVCENCGKEFLSWKSFLEHGKCSSEDAESLVSSPGSEDAEETRRGCGWSKRKRSLRAKVGYFNSNCPSSEEEDLANCLMMLSNAAVDPLVAAEPEESCASASKEEERRNPMNFIAPNTMACRAAPTENKAKGVANKGLFECKACKKVFNSHQALGGHRASHKKVKGCFAARLDQGLDDNSVAEEDAITNEEFFPTKSTIQFDRVSNYAQLGSASKRRSKVHECSICHRVFSSGQALGGHKRCHWITSNSPPDASSLDKLHQLQDHMEQIQQRPKLINITHETFDLTLDLNLPAPADDHAGEKRDHNNPGNPTSKDISTEIYLQCWAGVDAKEKDDNRYQDNENDEDNEKNNKDNNNNNKNNNNVVNNNNNCVSSVQNVDDEADSKVQLAKLSELKDMNVNGNSSPWLQVGIGSTAGVAADP